MFRKTFLPSEKILISGAGIAGLSLARELKKRKIPFKIIEKKTQLTPDGAGIALPANAVKALRYMGLGDQIDEHAHQVTQIIYTDSAGDVLSAASLLEKPLNTDRFVAISRQKLHDILHADFNDTIHFGVTIDKICQDQNKILVTFNNPEINKPEEFSVIIGADGINSGVRQLVFADNSLTDLNVTTWRWMCNYPEHNLQPTYMLGSHDIFMAYPIGKNEIYCYAHIFDPENLSEKISNHQDTLKKHFGQYGGVANAILKILPDNQLIIPGRLRSVTPPLFKKNRVALIGDAGHACSPMLQQGAAGALEDAIALSEFLENFPVDEALSHFEKFRSERVNWVAASSDGPMKMLININSDVLATIYQKIREQGPFNIQGWKKLLATDPISEIPAYIKKQNSEVETKTLDIQIL